VDPAEPRSTRETWKEPDVSIGAWESLGQLGLACLLSLVVGLEREFNAKPAGVRTYTLVGLGSALFTLVSRHGTWLLAGSGVTNVDGSRVAAQVVSGIGFFGAGLIFVRRDSVRGLTTAASIWLVAAIGMACGAGVAPLAVATVAIYLLVALGLPVLTNAIPHARRTRLSVRIAYDDGHGILRQLLASIGSIGMSVENLYVGEVDTSGQDAVAVVELAVYTAGGRASELLAMLEAQEGVRTVRIRTDHEAEEA